MLEKGHTACGLLRKLPYRGKETENKQVNNKIITDLMVGVMEEMYKVISTGLVGRCREGVRVISESLSQNLIDQKAQNLVTLYCEKQSIEISTIEG